MLAVLVVYSAVLILHAVVPGRWVDGYVVERGVRLGYHLNGLRVFGIVIAAYLALAYTGVIAWDIFYQERWYMLATANAIGVIFTLAIVLPYPPVERSLLKDLYLGRLANPRWRSGRIDAKMFLYLVGATMLELCLLSFAAHHWLTYREDSSLGVLLYTGLFTFFVVDYITFERVHLYTYDFVAERVGFKLGWGCLTFYPFFYCSGLWFAAGQPNPHPSKLGLVVSAVTFFAGWVFARGANLQKFHFKVNPDDTAFGPLVQRALVSGNKRILISGFWGLSRHVNYLGELLMATGLATSLGYPGTLWVWLYPLYYVALLVPRQLDDDKRCEQKYGELWNQYKQAVPRRIIPFIY